MGGLVGRLVVSVGLAVSAALVASAVRLRDVAFTSWYVPFSTLLLAVGLYGSTSAINLQAFRSQLRTILLAVTLGVLAKATIIASVMLLCFRNPAYAVLAMAVAQIDPLSVAALGARGTLTPRARSLLSAWASFDDPVTMLLTLQLLIVVRATGPGALGLVLHEGPGVLADFLLGLVANAALAAALAATWWLVRRWRGPRGRQVVFDVLEIGVLVAGAVVAVTQSLLLGLAAAGLFLRPRLLRGHPHGARVMEGITTAAFYTAVALLGLVSAGGIDIVPGVVLGVAAFGAQVVVGALLTARLPGDRLRLSLAQQNGITAILLGLIIEPVLPGSLGVIAPAILIVNVLYLMTNTAVGLRPFLLVESLLTRFGPTPPAAPASSPSGGEAPPTDGTETEPTDPPVRQMTSAPCAQAD